MKIALIGIGNVGEALADRLARSGHDVTIAVRDLNSDSVRSALKKNPRPQLLVSSEPC